MDLNPHSRNLGSAPVRATTLPTGDVKNKLGAPVNDDH